MHWDSSKKADLSHCHNSLLSQRRHVKSLGANEVIDYTSTSVLKGVLKHLLDGGYDAIIDLVGGMELLPHLNTLPKSVVAYVTLWEIKLRGTNEVVPLFILSSPELWRECRPAILVTERNVIALIYIPRRSTSEVCFYLVYWMGTHDTMAMEMYEKGDLKI